MNKKSKTKFASKNKIEKDLSVNISLKVGKKSAHAKAVENLKMCKAQERKESFIWVCHPTLPRTMIKKYV